MFLFFKILIILKSNKIIKNFPIGVKYLTSIKNKIYTIYNYFLPLTFLRNNNYCITCKNFEKYQYNYFIIGIINVKFVEINL